jgi:hypothetical protein
MIGHLSKIEIWIRAGMNSPICARMNSPICARINSWRRDMDHAVGIQKGSIKKLYLRQNKFVAHTICARMNSWRMDMDHAVGIQ